MTAFAVLLTVTGIPSAGTPIRPAPGTFFVSLRGNDEWSGRLPQPNAAGTDGPFRTLGRAREAVRKADKALDRKVVIRGGTYYLAQPLVLGPEDSGTPERPVTWMAYPGEEVVLSGGAPLKSWRQTDGGVWVGKLPAAKSGDLIRQFRVGKELQTLARHPNAVPDEPYTGGWLFAQPRRELLIGWGSSVVRIHTPGDWMEWDVEVPADAEYSLWLYYGAKNEPWGRTNMAGRTTIQVDGGENIWLENLPDTGGWGDFRWSRCALIRLSKGKHTLRWTNRKGGGINFDAFALCTDPEWTPVGTKLDKPGAGHHLIVVQAEAFDRGHGKEMGRQLTYNSRPDRLPFRPGDIPDGWDLTRAQIMIFPAWGWVGGPMLVSGIDRDAGILMLDNKRGGTDVRPGNRYYLQNVPQALDRPGEFYIDDSRGEIHYLPAEREFRKRETVVPVLDRIIHVKGDDSSGAWAENIHIRGLTFHDTTYSHDIGSFYVQPEAAVWLEYARGCVVRDCTFSLLGGYAVHLTQKTTQCKVLGCRMFENGGGGVLATGDTERQPTNCVIAGCHMHHLGLVYKHCAGVYITTGSGHRVAFNTITDVPRYAISFKSYGPKAASHRNVAEYNEMLRTNLETNDTGAIETLGRDRKPSGNVIRFNLILDVVGMKHRPEGGIITPHYTWGIYLDDYSSGTQVYGNIVARTVRGGYHNHLGFDNVVENNIFVDGQLQQFEYNGRAEMRRNVVRRNIVVWSNPEAIYCRSSGWSREVLRECDYNVVWCTAVDISSIDRAITPEGSWAKWVAAGFDAHSVVADPQFVDAAGDDYRLKPTSPALRLGFQPIPVERIGVRGYRAEDFE